MGERMYQFEIFAYERVFWGWDLSFLFLLAIHHQLKKLTPVATFSEMMTYNPQSSATSNSPLPAKNIRRIPVLFSFRKKRKNKQRKKNRP